MALRTASPLAHHSATRVTCAPARVQSLAPGMFLRARPPAHGHEGVQRPATDVFSPRRNVRLPVLQPYHPACRGQPLGQHRLRHGKLLRDVQPVAVLPMVSRDTACAFLHLLEQALLLAREGGQRQDVSHSGANVTVILLTSMRQTAT